MKNSERFHRAYSNLSIGLRREIIAVLEIDGIDQPITWNVAWLEVEAKTKLGERILKYLIGLDII